jgi:hexosaminidase
MENTSCVDYMAFPRLCAFAEVAWGKAVEHSSIDDFKVRLEEHLLRLDALGVNYRPLSGPRPWNARPDAPGKPRSMQHRLEKQSRFIADLL